jgi:hypothetical protein
MVYFILLGLKKYLLNRIKSVLESEENKDKIKRFEIPKGIVVCVEV